MTTPASPTASVHFWYVASSASVPLSVAARTASTFSWDWANTAQPSWNPTAGLLAGVVAGVELLDPVAGLALVLDLEDRDDLGVGVTAELDGRDGHAVAEPRVDVAVVVESRAVGLADQLLADLVPQLVDAVDADLVLEGGELVQGPEGVDLLPAGRVQVDAHVRDGGRRQCLRGLLALLEEPERRPGAGSHTEQRDDAATDPPAAPAASAR